MYNPAQMPPYELPVNSHTMGFKSNTTKGGGGYNEMVLIDGKAGELIRTHAQKDRDTTVKNDDTRKVFRNRDVKVFGWQKEEITGDMGTLVKEGNQTNTVETGNQTNVVSTGKQDNTVNQDISITSECGAIIIKAATQIVLEVGANKITIDDQGNIKVSATASTDVTAPQNHIGGETKMDGGKVFIN